MKKLFLLDAYALIFRSYYAFIKNPRINSKGENTSAIFGFVNTLLELIRKEQPDYLAVCFDPPGGNFRHELYPEYKANRSATPEDIKKSVPYIKDIISAFNIPVLEEQGYEADDLIGTLAKKMASDDLQVYMMTPDKDYAQLVDKQIFMYKPARSGNEAEIIDVEGVKAKFKIENPLQVIDILALWGDSADNIPGAPGVGEKTAQKLIEKYESVENLLENTADLKGKQKEKIEANKEQILLSKELATININVPTSAQLEDMKLSEPNNQRVKELFETLEFRNLLQRVSVLNETPASSDNNGQLDLFADQSAPSQNSLFNQIDDTKHQYNTIEDLNESIAFLKDLQQQAAFSFFIIKEGEHLFDQKIQGIAFSTQEAQATYLVFPSEDTLKEPLGQTFLEALKHCFESDSIEKMAYQLKEEVLCLKNYDIHLTEPVFDTFLAHYILEPELRHSFEYLSETLLAYKSLLFDVISEKKGSKQKKIAEIDLELISNYANERADINRQMADLLKADLKKTYSLDLYTEIELPLVFVLADMEYYGVSLDLPFLQNYSETLTAKANAIEQEIYDLAGETFNISSPKQLGIILFDKLKITDKPPLTKTKQYKTGEEIILKYREEHPIIDKILSYRGLKKLTSTYVDALPLLLNPVTHKIHTSFNQAVASTGRLSSTNPNLQNIPIREAEGREVRKAFIPSDEEHIFLSADYSQVELRLMAHLSQDEAMISAFKSETDIHTATASKIFKKTENEVTKEERSQAKSANFGIIYGISAFGLSQNMNISRKEAKQLIEGYFETYPKVKEYMDRCIFEARKYSTVSTLLGRKRHLKDINSQNAIVRGVAERNAINAPIQGSAADLIKVAMIEIHRQFKRHNLQSKMIIQVHDELNFDVLKSELPQVIDIVRTEMERAISISVPLTVELNTGDNWNEAH